MSVVDFVKDVKQGKVSVVEHTQKILNEIKKNNSKYAHFNLIAEKEALEQAKEIDARVKKGGAKGKLLGVPVSVKDCICVKGVESRSGSKILSGYVPTFGATVIEKLKREGAVIVGKTSQDEFGFGTFSVNVGIGFEKPKNPHDAERSCGGSSGGSAGATALTEFSHISIGESTGGSIAAPASFCGCVGLTPTYGRVSRYGLIDYSNSCDKIGPMGKTVADAALALEVIAGLDENDSTSLPNKIENYSSFVGKEIKNLKIGIVKELMGKGIDEGVKKVVLKAVEKLKELGVKVEETSLPLNSKYAIPAYYLIAPAEASTNLAKYCGMRYGMHEDLKGNFNEYFAAVRSKNFGEEAKRRILIGTFARMSGFRDAYYLRAMKARTLLIQEFKGAFKKYDLLLNPTMPVVAPKFSEIEKLTPMQHYTMDLCTVPANLVGLPHISLPVWESKGMPVGLMLSAVHLEEGKLIQAASALEEVVS